MKKWIYKDTSVTRANELSKEAGIGWIFSFLLIGRGIDCSSDVKNFVYPNISQMNNPFLLKDMDKAVDRIKKAIKNNEKITVYGDYDVDGLTSTAIILDMLSVFGVKADYYIPDRINEGYGLNKNALDIISQNGTKLIITVDLGSTAIEEVEYGNSLGLEFVITDHHQLMDSLPSACAVVNPHRDDCSYPFKNLAGVGVAFKLASAMLSDLYDNKIILQRYYDLLSLGTISDIVSLKDENRLYTKYGLKHFSSTKNEGLKALIKQCGFDASNFNETAIGFGIGPRINSAGRLGKVEVALKLLTTNNTHDAEFYAAQLCEMNNTRKTIEQDIFTEAEKQINEQETLDNILVVYSKGWHTGIIGIVASKLVDRYNRPTIILSIDENGSCHGSGRSIPGFNLFDALSFCSSYLQKYGGHEMAAGLTLNETDIPRFIKAINEYSSIVMSEDMFIPALEIDYEADPTEIGVELAEKLIFFEPYGQDNPKPVFSMRNMEVVSSSETRDGKHLRMRCSCMGKHFWCIGFNMASEKPAPGSIVDLAFNLEINEYNNTKDISLVIKDIHKH